MNKIIPFLIIALFICFQTHSQDFWDWTAPLPLTDSTSDNTNPFLHKTYLGASEILYLVWQKSSDSISTEIWIDNILDSEPPSVLLSDSGIHYTHPKIIEGDRWPTNDTMFFLIYLSNENGNIDINYTVRLNNGIFTPPEAITETPYDEDQLTVGASEFNKANSSFHANTIAWIGEGKLFLKNLIFEPSHQYFDETIILDSINCSDPCVFTMSDIHGDLMYVKEDSGSNHIWHSYSDWSGNWNTPQIFYDSTTSRNPAISIHYSTPVWTTFIDTSWRIMTEDYWIGSYLYYISKDTPFEPAAMNYVIGVKSNISELYIAVTYPENGYDEIYMNEWPGSTDFQNFSNSGRSNRNPRFFVGEHENSSCWYDYILWESYVNGHWQIWSSKTYMCVGMVWENESIDGILEIHPNPFTHETKLEFTLDTQSDVIIEVYNNRGMQVATIANQSFDQGEHQLRWDCGGVAAGIYIIKMTVGDMVYTSKVVKAD